ncbi:PTS family mannose fructose sorbose porter component IIB [Companilactobacillus kimchiensis]|uniref:PTS family mannose fructose sorbose porter component IIB n=2 Tax=Companilactobacillus kimchiensis TaxID=993692 RepID=A0A0R2LLS3_9LACO|nr:PTS family mannose fructose sorbose porter component IIB [Companilactobacillus kimchiensis]
MEDFIMTVVLARIDQRLIHGLIVNQWAQSLKVKRFMVIDDELSTNESIKASMRMSKPAGTGMSIIDTQKAITNFNAGKYDDQRVFVLVKEPETLIKLIDGGVKIPKIDLGIIFNENGRKPVSKFVALDDKERQDLQTIQEKGIPLIIQYVPTDNEEEFKA